MKFSAQTELRGDPRAPGLARAFVSAEIDRPEVAALTRADDVMLVVSELVTNAVQAGSETIALLLRVDPSGFEVIVEDDADGLPAPRVAAPDAVGGRGLSIVATLADTWAVAPCPGDRGKQVIARWLAS